MKKLTFLLVLVFCSFSSFGNNTTFLECSTVGNDIKSVSANIDAAIGSDHKRLKITVEHQNNKVDLFYPRIANDVLINSAFSRSITIIADLTSNNETDANSIKRLVLDISKDSGSLIALKEGERSIRSEVIKLDNELSCKWRM